LTVPRSKASNLVREGWDTDGEHLRRWRTLGALKDDLKRINASCEFISRSLSAALARSSHRSSHALSSAEPEKSGAPNRVASAIFTR